MLLTAYYVEKPRIKGQNRTDAWSFTLYTNMATEMFSSFILLLRSLCASS